MFPSSLLRELGADRLRLLRNRGLGRGWLRTAVADVLIRPGLRLMKLAFECGFGAFNEGFHASARTSRAGQFAAIAADAKRNQTVGRSKRLSIAIGPEFGGAFHKI